MSINKNTWIYLNKCNYEEWYKFIGTNCIIQIPLTIKDRESIINNHNVIFYKEKKEEKFAQISRVFWPKAQNLDEKGPIVCAVYISSNPKKSLVGDVDLVLCGFYFEVQSRVF